MHPSRTCLFAIVSAIGLTGCGFKLASSAAGRGGSGGSVALTGAAGSGEGGMGGKMAPPIIITDADLGFIDAGNDDGPASGMSTPDANCGAKGKTASKVTPDILVLLDRSASMSNDLNDMGCTTARDGGIPMGGFGDCGPNSKWAKIIPALTQVISETEQDVNWGLKFFPDNATSVCDVGTTPEVGIASKNATAIATAIKNATSTVGGVMLLGNNVIGTPTRSGETSAAKYLQSLTDKAPKFILLATDGLPTCPGTGSSMNSVNDSSAAVSAVIQDAQNAGFKTFVVGIGTNGTGDAILSDMANAGGLPRAGTPSYYGVTTAADLTAAIRTLIGVAGTCTFQIGPAPTDDGTTGLDRINVFGDGVEIPRDPSHAGGYDYTDSTMNSIEVHGSLCDQIMSGAIKTVTVTFQCHVT
jgi:hypothetical protein